MTDGIGRWKHIPGLRYPDYTRTGPDGVTRSTAFHERDGRGEPLPDLARMPGHVLYGWDSRDDEHVIGATRGHRWDSTRPGATIWGRDWSDQRIVDAVRDTIQTPTHRIEPHPRSVFRFVRREVCGVLIETRWTCKRGVASKIIGYPIRGPGILMVADDGVITPPAIHRRDTRFEELPP